jgi:hypothetical protein
MTSHDQEQGDALAPGMKDQWRSDEPAAREDLEDVDTGESGPQGGQLGSAGGGYGSGSASGTSGGPPDGEDVQQGAGPGPQTDWLRGAEGRSDDDGRELDR